MAKQISSDFVSQEPLMLKDFFDEPGVEIQGCILYKEKLYVAVDQRIFRITDFENEDVDTELVLDRYFEDSGGENGQFTSFYIYNDILFAGMKAVRFGSPQPAWYTTTGNVDEWVECNFGDDINFQTNQKNVESFVERDGELFTIGNGSGGDSFRMTTLGRFKPYDGMAGKLFGDTPGKSTVAENNIYFIDGKQLRVIHDVVQNPNFEKFTGLEPAFWTRETAFSQFNVTQPGSDSSSIKPLPFSIRLGSSKFGDHAIDIRNKHTEIQVQIGEDEEGNPIYAVYYAVDNNSIYQDVPVIPFSKMGYAIWHAGTVFGVSMASKLQIFDENGESPELNPPTTIPPPPDHVPELALVDNNYLAGWGAGGTPEWQDLVDGEESEAFLNVPAWGEYMRITLYASQVYR